LQQRKGTILFFSKWAKAHVQTVAEPCQGEIWQWCSPHFVPHFAERSWDVYCELWVCFWGITWNISYCNCNYCWFLSFALRERAIVHSVAGLFEGVSVIASGCFALTLGTCTQWCLISWPIRPF
jgi:hypothetical protein